MFNSNKNKNDEDRGLHKCEWVKDITIPNEFSSNFEQKRYFNQLRDMLIKTLPEKELNDFVKMLNRKQGLYKGNMCENAVRYSIMVIKNKFNKIDIHQQINKIDEELEKSRLKKFEDYRAELALKNNIKSGYVPTAQVLSKLPPIEIIEYVGFKLIKYNKFNGYYSAALIYPVSLNKPCKIYYNENPQKLEDEIDSIFENETENYIKQKSNPYGDKVLSVNNDIDISNVESVMKGIGGKEIDPLSEDIF